MVHNYPLRYCLLLAVSLLTLPFASAATITVTSTADDGSGTLRQSIRMAMAGDTIAFASSTDRKAITLLTVINIEKDLTVLGNGMRTTLLSGNKTNRAFSVRKGATVTIKDLAIYNGVERIGGGLRVRATSTLTAERIYIYDCIANGPVATQGGGAVFNEGTLMLKDAILDGNAATGPAGSGGAILNAPGGTLTIMGGRIERNMANRAGGGIEETSGSGTMVTITNARINRNVVNMAPGNGGGIHVGGDGDLMITGGTVDLNEAGAEGGGLWNGAGTMTVSGTLVRQNIAKGDDADMGGGGLYNNGMGTIILKDNARVLGNKATGTSGSGGGVLNNVGATLQIMNSWVSGNEANRAGGGIEDVSGSGTEFTVMNSKIDDNVVNDAPGNGGGIHIGGDGSLTVTGGTVSGNSAGAEGGGIWNNLGTLTVTGGTRIRNNVAMGDDADMGGGGLYNNGGGTIIVSNGVSIRGNKATGMSGSGGGILNNVGATLTIMGSRIEANEANRAGGGIEDASGAGSEVTITDTKLDRNVVNNAPGNGGAIHVGSDGDLMISNSKVIANMAGAEGGGLWNGAGTMTVSATEITDNVAMGDEADMGGGGLYNNGMGTIIVSDGTVIMRNKATGMSGSGGGILNNVGATLTVSDSRIERNEANRAGGGIEDASGSGTVVTITNTRINRNVVNMAPGNGGGIHVGSDGDLMITGGTVDLNEAGAEGGGLWNGGGTMTVNRTLIRKNVAKGDDADMGGGGLYNNGGGTIVLNNNVRVFDNKATGMSGSGGGILNNVGATLKISDSQISGNEANRAGGGIEDASGAATEFTVMNTTIERNVVNTAPGNGGGIHVGGDGNLMITGGMVNTNVAGQEGGGLWNGAGTMTVTNVLLRDNVALGNDADDGGGALFNLAGTLVVNNARLHGNKATGTSGSGGGLLSIAGAVTVDGGTIRNNVANRAGGGVEIVDGSYTSTDVTYDGNDAGSNPGNGGAFHVTGMMSTVDITGGEVTNNVAANEGGGVWNQSGTMMMLSKVGILSNTVTDEGSLEKRVAGGGVFNNGGILDIESSTIAKNRMTGTITAGGGIANNTGGTLTLTTSTVSGNQGGLAGGGVANDGMMEITNSTIAMNNARGGGGFAQATNAASLTITGTIIAQNSANLARDFATVAGMVTSDGFNLIGEDRFEQFPATETDKENVAANLLPLTDNGGMTMTHAPSCESPAIDMGDPDDQSPDQIGQPVFGGQRDIGSFERQGPCGIVAPAIVADPDLAPASTSASEVLSVFPNPAATDYLMVALPARFAGDVTIRVTGMDGRTRSVGSIQTAQYRLDLSDYAPGTYTLQAVSGAELESIRFVVAR